jgi:hypothetical protein
MATKAGAADVHEHASKRDRVEAGAHSQGATSLEGMIMALTTGSAAAADDENPSKRRRVESVSGGVSSLEAVIDNCLLTILSLLSVEDMNSFAICSRRCREVRSNPLLDQTRTGTIICSEISSIPKIYDAIAAGHWNNELYSGNRTHLRIIGLDRVEERYSGMNRVERRNISTRIKEVERRARKGYDVRLYSVTSLDLSCSPDDNHGRIKYASCTGLALILPNLRNLDLSYLRLQGRVMVNFFEKCPHLTRVTFSGPIGISLSGDYFWRARYVTELNLLDSTFPPCAHPSPLYWEEELRYAGRNYYMLMNCKHLERVTIKNTTWQAVEVEGEAQPLSQGIIIKFVRHTPTLRWLRSDLTEENVAMLQQERPDITFVSD